MTLSNSVKYFPLIETDLIFDSSNSISSVLLQETQPQKYSLPVLKYKVPDSSASIVTGRTVLRSNIGGGDMFRIRPDGSWSQLSLPYNGYRVFHEDKVTEAWRWPPIPSNFEVKGRVQVPLLPLWNFVACYRVTFTFTLTHLLHCAESFLRS